MIRRLAFLLFILVVVAGAAAGVYYFVPLVGDLSNEALAHSVAREGEALDGSESGRRCRRQGERRYSCRVPSRSGGGAVTYRVRLEGRRCWNARRTGARGEGRRLEGCVGLRDQIRLLDEIL